MTAALTATAIAAAAFTSLAAISPHLAAISLHLAAISPHLAAISPHLAARQGGRQREQLLQPVEPARHRARYDLAAWQHARLG